MHMNRIFRLRDAVPSHGIQMPHFRLYFVPLFFMANKFLTAIRLLLRTVRNIFIQLNEFLENCVQGKPLNNEGISKTSLIKVSK